MLASNGTKPAGFGILESLVGIVLIAISAFAFQSLMRVLFQSQRRVDVKAGTLELRTLIDSLLVDEPSCTAIIVAGINTRTFDSRPDRLADYNDHPIVSQLILQLGARQIASDTVQRNFTLRDLRINLEGPLPALPDRYLGFIAMSFDSDQIAEPGGQARSMIGGEVRQTQVPLLFNTEADPDNPEIRRIISCMGRGPNTPTNPSRCNVGQVQVGIDNNGRVLCEPEEPCQAGQHLARGIIINRENGQPVLDAAGEPQEGWVCTANADESIDFIELCDGGCI